MFRNEGDKETQTAPQSWTRLSAQSEAQTLCLEQNMGLMFHSKIASNSETSQFTVFTQYIRFWATVRTCNVHTGSSACMCTVQLILSALVVIGLSNRITSVRMTLYNQMLNAFFI